MIVSPSVRHTTILAAATLLLPALRAAAEEIHWHRDYRAAWTESRDTHKPLLIDVETDPCFWCKKLDATTLRDPAVAGLVNRAFVPLKIDARHEPDLARGLRVHSYPTLVF